MFRTLFNRKELETKLEALQTHINALEAENKLLSTRLSKQELRAKRAVADKQEADLALKKAEEKIETVARALATLKEEKQKNEGVRYKRAVTLTNAQSCDLLFQISSIRSRNEDLISVYLRPEESFADLNESGIELDHEVKYLLPRIASPTGMALFYDMKRIGIVPGVVTPPFPVRESGWKRDHVFDTKPLQELLERDQVFCIVLAHAGETFIGISTRDAFIDYRTVRSSVKEKHTKGGWSQRRFERLRNEDIRHHAEKARGVFEALVRDYNNELKMVVASGEPNLIKEIARGDYPFPLLIRRIDMNARIEKQNIDKIRVLAWSASWYTI